MDSGGKWNECRARGTRRPDCGWLAGWGQGWGGVSWGVLGGLVTKLVPPVKRYIQLPESNIYPVINMQRRARTPARFDPVISQNLAKLDSGPDKMWRRNLHANTFFPVWCDVMRCVCVCAILRSHFVSYPVPIFVSLPYLPFTSLLYPPPTLLCYTLP